MTEAQQWAKVRYVEEIAKEVGVKINFSYTTLKTRCF